MNVFERKHWSPLSAGIVVLVAIMVARALYIHSFALPVPYWDQWDAEGAFLLIPWENSDLTLSQMFSPHNEHRIFWSRLLSLLLYEASGKQWNNVTLAYVSSGILSIAIAGITCLIWRSSAELLPKLGTSLVLVALGVLPLAWENIVAGFQNVFYFMVLWGVIGIALTVYARTVAWRLLALLAALACVFTMASGVIWIGAMVLIGVVRAVQEGRVTTGSLAYLLALASIMVWGYDLVPAIEGHASLRPSSTAEFLTAATKGLSWPWLSRSWAAAILWFPALCAGVLALLRRLPARTDQFMLALAAMAFGQALAIAYSRGQGMTDVSSRYSELLMLGMAGNAWLALRIPSWATSASSARLERYAPALACCACAWLAFLGWATLVRLPGDIAGLQHRHQVSCLQTQNIRQFLEHGEPEDLDKPPLEIPYPSAERLILLASDPVLNSALQHLRKGSATEGCALEHQRVISPNVDQGLGGLAIGLKPGSAMQLQYESPTTASLQGMSLLIGTYAGLADGTIKVEACAANTCTASSTLVAGAEDNSPLRFRFTAPLRVQQGDLIEITLSLHDATHAVAFWSYVPASTPAPVINDGEGEHRAVLASFFFQD